MCTRCRMNWYCAGLGEDDYENGDRITDLLDMRNDNRGEQQ